MEPKLSILHIEDEPADSAIVSALLRREGFSADLHRVATMEEFRQALEGGTYDLILSDYSLPGLDPLEALRYVRARRPELPFIFLSGVLGEEQAIECLKLGATDYLLKHNTAKLVPAVRRALHEAQEHACRLQAEAAQRASEEKFRTLFEQAAIGMGRVRFDDARWVDVNDAFCRMLGRAREEMLATPWPAMTHPGDLDLDLIPFRRMAAGELERYSIEKRFIHKDGHPIWARLNLSLVRDSQGRPDYEIAIIEDITERKRAEAALRESEARERRRAEELDAAVQGRDEALAQLNALVEHAPVGFAFFDREQRYIRINHFLANEMHGRAVESHLGRRVREVLPAAAQAIEPLLQTIFACGSPVENVILTTESPGSSRRQRHWLTAWFPVKTSDGRIPWVGAAVMDITRQIRTEAALRQSQQALQAAKEDLARANTELEAKVERRTAKLRETIAELEGFSYSLVHDMRAPLRAITAYAGIVEEEAGSRLQPAETDLLHKLKNACHRMDQLITDSLNYSRILRQELPLAPVHLPGLLRGLVESYPNLQPPAADITLDTGELVVVGNEAALTQVFSNLLGNAVKFVAPGVHPRIRIWAETRPPRPTPQPGTAGASDASRPVAIIWVEDNGIGIPKEQQENIFGMFQRLHRSEEYPGTGIGLAIVQKSLERLGGQVCLDSEPGKGSRFCVQLPLAPQVADSAERKRAA